MHKLLGSVSPWALVAMNAEGGAGGSGGGDATVTPPESVLFPNEGQSADAGGQQTNSDSDQSAGDWKEYENDPAKSAEENAAAKVEHDKTKPAEKTDAETAADQVPADGKYTFTMPEGVELDQALADALMPDFKEMGLTQGQAQKLIDKYIATNQARLEGHAASPEGAWSGAAYQYFKDNGTPDTWADKAKADKDIGGTAWNGTVTDATRFINTMGTPELKAFLNASGGGNHPELIRIFAKAGALIKEDNPANGGAGGSGKPVEAAHVLFPNDAPKG